MKDQIIEKYIDFVLTEERKPKSVYKFAKLLEIEEREFYKHFTSIDHIEQSIYAHLVEASGATVNADLADKEPTSREKLLAFYFTLFENLTLNRSYVLFDAEHGEGGMNGVLAKMKKPVSAYLTEITHMLKFSAIEAIPGGENVNSIATKSATSFLWTQFTTLFKYWVKDTSVDFENTDAFIEKSVRLTDDLYRAIPVDSLLDYGKFIYHEMKNSWK